MAIAGIRIIRRMALAGFALALLTGCGNGGTTYVSEGVYDDPYYDRWDDDHDYRVSIHDHHHRRYSHTRPAGSMPDRPRARHTRRHRGRRR